MLLRCTWRFIYRCGLNGGRSSNGYREVMVQGTGDPEVRDRRQVEGLRDGKGYNTAYHRGYRSFRVVIQGTGVLRHHDNSSKPV